MLVGEFAETQRLIEESVNSEDHFKEILRLIGHTREGTDGFDLETAYESIKKSIEDPNWFNKSLPIKAFNWIKK